MWLLRKMRSGVSYAKAFRDMRSVRIWRSMSRKESCFARRCNSGVVAMHPNFWEGLWPTGRHAIVVIIRYGAPAGQRDEVMMSRFFEDGNGAPRPSTGAMGADRIMYVNAKGSMKVGATC